MAVDNLTKPHDEFAFLIGAYEALARLLPIDTPEWVLLETLNRQFRQCLDRSDQRGLLS